MLITSHFALEEFACHNGTPYPLEWIGDRLVPLCDALEILRLELGGLALHIDSGYRTAEYNARLYGAVPDSQHVQGRAADVISTHPAAHVHAVALQLYHHGRIKIGGLGAYPTFTHIDVRPGERLAQWYGGRASN